MGSEENIDKSDLLNENLDGGGDNIDINHIVLDNRYAQMVQDLLEMRK